MLTEAHSHRCTLAQGWSFFSTSLTPLLILLVLLLSILPHQITASPAPVPTLRDRGNHPVQGQQGQGGESPYPKPISTPIATLLPGSSLHQGQGQGQNQGQGQGQGPYAGLSQGQISGQDQAQGQGQGHVQGQGQGQNQGQGQGQGQGLGEGQDQGQAQGSHYNSNSNSDSDSDFGDDVGDYSDNDSEDNDSEDFSGSSSETENGDGNGNGWTLSLYRDTQCSGQPMHFSGTSSLTCSSSRGGFSEAAFIANLNGCRVLFYEQDGCTGAGRAGSSDGSKSCAVPGDYDGGDDDDGENKDGDGEDYDKEKLKGRLAERGSPNSRSLRQGIDSREDRGDDGDENRNSSAVIKSFKIICS